MTSGNLIEKVSRSMCQAAGFDPDWERRTDQAVTWQLYSDQAQALITALLRELSEPSAEMLLEGLKFKGDSPEDTKRAWRAMLRTFAQEQGIKLEA
jgi:hypothetical protein